MVQTVVVLLTALTLLGCTAEMKARAYASEDRDTWQQPERVLAELGIVSGQSVADLGSGGGYFTFRLASAVGSDGRPSFSGRRPPRAPELISLERTGARPKLDSRE